MHLVPAALGEGLDQPDDLDPGLEGVISGDQPDVPAADDEQPIGRPDEIAVDQGLERTGPVDAGEGVTPEYERSLPRTGGDEEDFRLDEDVFRAVRSLKAATAVEFSQISFDG